jgi:hypothetical protein
MCPGEKASTQFEVWACCGCQGGLYFDIIENCSWISVKPTSGYSVGERHKITVTVDTTGLSEGVYTYKIRISSNDGVGFFEVRVNVSENATPPSIHIVKPERGVIYMNDRALMRIGVLTLVIDSVNIEVNATGGRSKLEKVDFYINGKLVATRSSEPYRWLWSEPGFLRCRVKVVACNEYNRTASDEIIVWKLP